jgi:hypothetical protein
MSADTSITHDELSPLKQFAAAYLAIRDLLDAAVVPGVPQEPMGWVRYEEHLVVLRQHGPAVAALLEQRGRETPEAARRIVCGVTDGCDLARAQFQRHPYPYQFQVRAQVRGIVGELVWPLQQFLARVEQEEMRRTAADNTAEAPLLDRVLDILTTNQGHIMGYLWDKKTASYAKLRTIPRAWRETPSHEAITAALKKMQVKLNAANLPVALTVSDAKERVTLDRPAD